jgi:hypothetical protein
MNSFTNTLSNVLEYNAFIFDMTLKSALQPACTLEITFPSEFIITDVPLATCRLSSTSGLSSSYQCSFLTNKLIVSSLFGTTTSVGGERIKFTVANNYV